MPAEERREHALVFASNHARIAEMRYGPHTNTAINIPPTHNTYYIPGIQNEYEYEYSRKKRGESGAHNTRTI